MIHNEHGSQPKFIYFVGFFGGCCYFVLFLLFWFDLPPARPMLVDHLVNKTAVRMAKSRLPSHAWDTKQKLTSAFFF
jgi:hypothetical protein